MSGYVGNLSAKQEDALRRIKHAVADVHKHTYDDHYYLRWLRAREFDVSKAETMMRKHLVFRKKYSVDAILSDYKVPELIDKCYPRGYIGPDKDGCPVRYIPFNNLDLRGFSYSVKKSDILKFLTFIFEQDIKEMERMSKKIGKVLEKHSYILDFDGYTFQQASNKDALSLLNEILKLYEAHYPERMKTCYFINVPVYFNIILSLSKPFLSENTIKKFRTFRKDFQKALLADIDAEILPKYLGGLRTDPDGNPMCLSFINYGAFIPPENYIIKNSMASLEEQEGVCSVKVPRQSFRLVDVVVPQPHSTMEWLFETPCKDIAVGLYLRHGDDLEEILSPERVSCHLVPESGTFPCDLAGTYVLKFDNTFSWMASKKVFYQIKVIPPHDQTSLNE